MTVVERRVDYVTRCLNCGADETDAPGVTVVQHEPDDRDPRKSLTEQTRREYECEACGATDEHKGIVCNGERFETTTVPVDGPTMVIKIDGTEIQYRQAEAFVLEQELYDRSGLTTAGRNRQVRIWAFKPPTFTKGNAHRVQLGEYLDERMLLTGIRYYTSDDPWRRLSFTRGLDHGVIETVTGLTEDAEGRGGSE